MLSGLSGRIAAVVDGGPTKIGLESTIVGMADGRVVVLREGGLAREEIEEALGTELGERTSDEISAPGQLTSHYAPRHPVRLNASLPTDDEIYLGFGGLPAGASGLDLSPRGDLVEAAANLFAYLHQLDRAGRAIAIAPIPEIGLGVAINDRIRRAAVRSDS